MAANKIVIVAGQEFSVPTTYSNEEIRTHLKQDFPDVANATVTTGKRTVGDDEVETVEFVKKAGTKGVDLARLLTSVPARQMPNLTSDKAHVDALLTGQLTFGEAERYGAIQAMDRLTDNSTGSRGISDRSQGDQLCRRIEAVGAVASDTLPLGW